MMLLLLNKNLIVSDTFEHFEIELNSNFFNNSIIIAAIYKLLNTSIVNFNNEFQCYASMFSNCKITVLVCCDFNVNLLNVDKSSQVSKLLDSMQNNTFPVIHWPTRVATYSASLIDNIFCNTISIFNSGVILILDLSDHFPVFPVLDISYSTIIPPNDNTIECDLIRPLTSHSI